MTRMRQTGIPCFGESSESRESGGGRGVGRRPPQMAAGHRGGARGWAPQREGYGGRRGRIPPQQYHGGPTDYPQGRGGQQYQRGGPSSQRHGGFPGDRGSGAPSGLPPPKLHQATHSPFHAVMMSQPTPYQGGPEAHEGPSSYSQSPELTSSELVAQFQPLSIEPEVAQSQEMHPASSKSMRFPLRPGKGIYGARCVVKANHFFAELPDKDLHQYDVSITPEVTSRGVNRAVMEQLVKLYQESYMGKRLPAHDGKKSFYTAGPLPFASK